MRIAVDAMGGDVGPAIVVPGAVAGARARGVGVVLVGRRAEIEPELARLDTSGLDVTVLEAADVIEMDEHPAQAVRRKPRSSIALALDEVKGARAAAMVSAGNTGAVMAAALFVLGRIPGVERPALASVVPTARGRSLLLDLGAVTDAKPHHLVQFAQMGHAYARQVLGLPRPSVGLLSNGEEPTKGNRLVQETFPLLAEALGTDFRGNVEGRDLALGTTDVIVTDGFTGNVALKTAEGVATMMGDLIRAELTRTTSRKLAAALLRPAFRAVRARLDPSEYGGAPLLGVNGVVVIGHGRSDAKAIAAAIGAAREAAEHNLVAAIAAALMPSPRQPTATPGEEPAAPSGNSTARDPT